MAKQYLGPLKVVPKTGQESFISEGQPLGFQLIEFWRWYVSDLVMNVTRGSLAEYLVAQALGVPNDGVRMEWDAYDVLTPDGIRVEVKSSAYLQSWSQADFSRISFDISPSQGWDHRTNETSSESIRQSDVYVFALLHHRDKTTVDPLNLDQWTFYVMATSVLDQQVPEQESITLSSLLSLNPIKTSFSELKAAVYELLD